VVLTLLGGIGLRLGHAAFAGLVIWALWVGYILAMSAAQQRGR
jgi:hypothetical protein